MKFTSSISCYLLINLIKLTKAAGLHGSGLSLGARDYFELVTSYMLCIVGGAGRVQCYLKIVLPKL